MSNQKEELTLRIKAKKKRLSAKLAQLKADARGEINEEQDKLKSKIDKLEDALGEIGYNFSDSVAKKINKWLK
jgi:Skp family chaperone for outer membrane proteins